MHTFTQHWISTGSLVKIRKAPSGQQNPGRWWEKTNYFYVAQAWASKKFIIIYSNPYAVPVSEQLDFNQHDICAMKEFDDIVKNYPLLIGKVLLLRLSPTSAHLPFMCLQRGMVLDLSTSHAYSSLIDWLDALDKARHDTSHCRQEPLSTIALNATHEATLATLRQAVDQKGTSREMLVISRQNGLRLLSSRLSGYRQKATRWSAAAMICTDRLRVKLKDLRGGVPVGRFFPFFFVGFCICGSPHGLLSCLSFSACVNGRDVRELDDLFIVLLLVFREPSSWRGRSDHVDENINQAFS